MNISPPLARRPSRLDACFRSVALLPLLGLTIATASAIPMVATTGSSLVKFDSATPGTVTSVAISGLQSGEALVGLDYRPATGQLYGIGSGSRVYVLNSSTGAATFVGVFSALNGLDFGSDFNPVVDRLRLVSNTEQNLRLNPNTGTIAAVDSNLNPAGNVVAVAYTNNFAGATETTLYGIDSVSGQLVRIGDVNGTPDSPNTGKITPIGSLGLGTNLSPAIGFDITPNGIAYASITAGGSTRLYLINLVDGTATSTGLIFNGSVSLNSLAAVAGPIVVTNTNNAGAGSLRQAIADANGTLSADDAIVFSIPGAGPHVITPTTPLPAIIDNVIIDGTTEPDFDAATRAPVVVIDGSSAGLDATGLAISGSAASGSRIRGLQIIRFSGTGIRILDAPSVHIAGNYIGTDGAAVLRNGTIESGSGVAVEGASANVIIGGDTPADRNVISGNGNAEIRVTGSGTAGTVVRGNFIGLNAAGTALLETFGTGIDGKSAAQLTIGGGTPGMGNVISGHGVAINMANAQNCTIAGNHIGTNAAGTAAIGNGGGIYASASNLVIGGALPGSRNVISGNGVGIQVASSTGTNLVHGNFIGTDAAGVAAIPNTIGVYIDGSTGVAIGEGNTGNLISGNGTGIVIKAASQNSVRANFIGTAADGISPLGNKNAGINIQSELVDADTANNVIGGGDVNNVIAFNGGPGVLLTGPKTFQNRIRKNSIYSNGGLGIDLNDDGVTANDAGDADTGANQSQNFPVLSVAKNDTAGTTTIQGTLNAEPGSEHLIDFYTSDVADPSGHGEGRTYLGTISVGDPDPNGNIAFSTTFAATAGQVLTATATRSNGDTSEFSPAITIAGPVPARLANISTRLRVETGDRVLIGGFIINGNATKKVIVRAVGPSTGVAGALADPALEVYDSNDQIVASNNNWRENANAQEISDSTLAPANDLEAAFLGGLAPGAYTAVVYGVGDTTGIGLVEVYDLDQGADARLANIATRGFVQTGDDVLIGGLIITGETQLKLLLRGIGPSLTIDGKLADPTLELFNANGDSVAFNNNWRDTQEADIGATSIAPSNDLESAILSTLAPADYTAILRGVNDTTGIGVVEIYALD